MLRILDKNKAPVKGLRVYKDCSRCKTRALYHYRRIKHSQRLANERYKYAGRNITGHWKLK